MWQDCVSLQSQRPHFSVIVPHKSTASTCELRWASSRLCLIPAPDRPVRCGCRSHCHSADRGQKHPESRQTPGQGTSRSRIGRTPAHRPGSRLHTPKPQPLSEQVSHPLSCPRPCPTLLSLPNSLPFHPSQGHSGGAQEACPLVKFSSPLAPHGPASGG